MSDPMEVVQRLGAALNARDLDAAVACFADDCVFEDTEPAPDGTRYEGRDALRAAWAPMLDQTSLTFEPEETFAAGDRVVQLSRYAWSDGHVRGVQVYRVRDGLVSELFAYVKG
jgi:ketosteroid isomerase-like protein